MRHCIMIGLALVIAAACGVADDVSELLRELSDPSPEVRQAAEDQLFQQGETVREVLQAHFDQLDPEAQFRVEILLERLDAQAAGLSHDELRDLKQHIDELHSDDQRARALAQKNLMTTIRQMPGTRISHRGAVVLLRILLPAFEDNNAQILAVIPQIAYSLEHVDAELEALLSGVDAKLRWGVLLPMALGSGVASSLHAPLAEAVASDGLAEIEVEVALAACLCDDAELRAVLLDRALSPPYLHGALTVLSFAGVVPDDRLREVVELLVALSRADGKSARSATAVRGDLLGLGQDGGSARERLLLDGEGYDRFSWTDAPLYTRTIEAAWGPDGFVGELKEGRSAGLFWTAYPQGSAIGVMLARGLADGRLAMLQITLANRTFCNIFSQDDGYRLTIPRYAKNSFNWWMLELSRQPFAALDTEASIEVRVLERLLDSERRDLSGMLKTQQLSIAHLESLLPQLSSEAALELASQIAGASPPAVEYLAGRCRDADARVRFQAAETLALLGAPEAVEVAAAFLADGRRGAALAIIDALRPSTRLGKLDPHLLLPFLKSDSKALAARAVIHLEEMDGRLPGEHALDPAAVDALIAPWIEKLSNDSGEQP